MLCAMFCTMCISLVPRLLVGPPTESLGTRLYVYVLLVYVVRCKEVYRSLFRIETWKGNCQYGQVISVAVQVHREIWVYCYIPYVPVKLDFSL